MEKTYIQQRENIEEVSEIQKMFSYAECNSQDIEVDEKLNVTCGEFKNMKITKEFYVNLCKILKIPYQFGKIIPIDLLLTNIDRLKNEFQNVVEIVYRGDTLVNIVPALNKKRKHIHFQKIDTSLLLEYFNNDNFEFKNIFIGDTGATIDVMHKDLGSFEVTKEGDIVEVGYRIRNPFTRFDNRLSMELILNQLVCTNGMVMPKKFGAFSLGLNKQLGDDSIFISKFRDGIDGQISKVYSIDKIRNIYKQLTTVNIKNMWLRPIISKLKGIDEDFLSDVMKIDWQAEKESWANEFANNKNGESEFNYFNTIFNMTKQAQELSIPARIELEDFNKKVISLFENQMSNSNVE